MERTTQIDSVFWLGTAIMMFLAFGIIFLVLFYQNYFSRMKQREAEHLLKVSLESEKNERKRIAADLHDSVSGDLVAIRNYLIILQKQGGAIDKTTFDELREGVDNALQNTRQVSYKLMPPLLDTLGLASAISDHFERLTKKTSAVFRASGTNPELSSEIAYELFRIIQEFATNMLKYGDISECDVTLSEAAGNLSIEIKDDGKPYDFNKVLAASSGTGLKNITSRLKVIGAALHQQHTVKGNHFAITLKHKKC